MTHTRDSQDSELANMDRARRLWLRKFRIAAGGWSQALEELEAALAPHHAPTSSVLVDLAARCADAADAVECALAGRYAGSDWQAHCLDEARAERSAMAELQLELMSQPGFLRVAVALLADARAELRSRRDAFDRLCGALEQCPLPGLRGAPSRVLCSPQSSRAAICSCARRHGTTR